MSKIILDFPHLLSASLFVLCVLVILWLFLKRKIRVKKLKRWWRLLTDRFHEYQFLKVPEFNDNFQQNLLYRRISLYVNSLESIEDSDYTNLFSGSKSNDILLTLNPNQTIEDEFLGARVSWTYKVTKNDVVEGDCRAFVLRIRKRDKRRILRPYLQHIHTVIDEIEERKREIRLFINHDGADGGGRWRSVPFTHPATIEAVAMDSELKAKIKADLEGFLKSKQYYHRLGRPWRRSYLLYGPSGTGKSSFVSAMAKLLNYDVYDVDLSKISGDSDLKLLLLQTTNRSLILVEDFDKYVAGNVTGDVTRESCSPASATVTGILQFMDGIVSACCDERIMVFTMTSKDKIDPAVLRPGRVDVHIHFPLCDFKNFKNLASNYLGINDHKLFPNVEEMFQIGAALSPAEIGELMVANRGSPSRALKSVIVALQTDGERRRASSAKAVEMGMGEVGCRDGMKELRKFYGILRRKSSRKYEPFDLGE